MLSILIPIYNYNVTELIVQLHKQLTKSGIIFEIICYDDASDEKYNIINSVIENKNHTSLIISNKNNGSVYARQQLCNKANYSWLLFLDADVLPRQTNFIKNYIIAIETNTNNMAIYGGFYYSNTQPEASYTLRWKYGKNKEQKSAFIRNKTPYKVLMSANFLIKKDTFNFINSKIKNNGYGLDNYFSSLLKKHQYKVLHIDNEVIHLGIEKSNIYLNKMEAAVRTLLSLYDKKKITTHQNNLLSLFITCKRYGLNYIFNYFYKIFSKQLKKNLLSKNPSIKLLQLYKISYFCYIDLNSQL